MKAYFYLVFSTENEEPQDLFSAESNVAAVTLRNISLQKSGISMRVNTSLLFVYVQEFVLFEFRWPWVSSERGFPLKESKKKRLFSGNLQRDSEISSFLDEL
ncbi:hypothetical protein NPIL_183331 [Nephila pilipes]|uniref:Uncharacterized protein n=1 Tax=Nephila pilipes TaxID=299642 RepID=A0A8X6TCH5_NEPPI|nr:hypothetical protein NPIL_183331 [Nephila pilipes]